MMFSSFSDIGKLGCKFYIMWCFAHNSFGMPPFLACSSEIGITKHGLATFCLCGACQCMHKNVLIIGKSVVDCSLSHSIVLVY